MNDKEIQDCCYDRNDYPFIINDDYLEHIKGKKYYSVKGERPRIVTLEITSFIGMCGGAMHYYGKLTTSGVHVKEFGGDPRYDHGGYLGCDGELFKITDIQIELAYKTPYECMFDRLSTQTTTRWEPKSALIKFAKEVFKARFKGDWKFDINDRT